MEEISRRVGELAGFLWGAPLVILIGMTSLYLTVGLRGIQFRKTIFAIRTLLGSIGKSDGSKGDISPLQALTTSLSATVGVGNIAGVARSKFSLFRQVTKCQFVWQNSGIYGILNDCYSITH